jgi:hypothetical protein
MKNPALFESSVWWEPIGDQLAAEAIDDPNALTAAAAVNSRTLRLENLLMSTTPCESQLDRQRISRPRSPTWLR